MQDPALVHVIHRFCHRLHEPRRRFRFAGEFAELPIEARTVDQLHDDEKAPVDLAEREDPHDLRVVEHRGDLGLIRAPPQAILGRHGTGPEHLQGHESVLAEIAGLIDDPHIAAAQLLDQLEVAELADVHGTLRSPIVPKSASRVKLRDFDFGMRSETDTHVIERPGSSSARRPPSPPRPRGCQRSGE